MAPSFGIHAKQTKDQILRFCYPQLHEQRKRATLEASRRSPEVLHDSSLCSHHNRLPQSNQCRQKSVGAFPSGTLCLSILLLTFCFPHFFCLYLVQSCAPASLIPLNSSTFACAHVFFLWNRRPSGQATASEKALVEISHLRLTMFRRWINVRRFRA